jgi:hypothetical protein
MLATVTICALWIAVAAASFAFFVVVNEPLYTDGGANRVFIAFVLYTFAVVTAITFTIFFVFGVPPAIS